MTMTVDEFEAGSFPLHDTLGPAERRFLLDAIDCYRLTDGFESRDDAEAQEMCAIEEYVHDVIRWVIVGDQQYDVSDRYIHAR